MHSLVDGFMGSWVHGFFNTRQKALQHCPGSNTKQRFFNTAQEDDASCNRLAGTSHKDVQQLCEGHNGGACKRTTRHDLTHTISSYTMWCVTIIQIETMWKPHLGVIRARLWSCRGCALIMFWTLFAPFCLFCLLDFLFRISLQLAWLWSVMLGCAWLRLGQDLLDLMMLL